MSPEFHASLHQIAIDVFAAIGATVVVLALIILIGVATGKIGFRGSKVEIMHKEDYDYD